MYLVQILLPRSSRREPLPDAAFATTRAELVEAFGGVTAYVQSPAQGVWVAPSGRLRATAW
jgi:hypothetical protein